MPELAAAGSVCFEQWYRFAWGGGLHCPRTAATDTVADALSSTGGDIRELLVAITVSDAFRYRYGEAPTPLEPIDESDPEFVIPDLRRVIP